MPKTSALACSYRCPQTCAPLAARMSSAQAAAGPPYTARHQIRYVQGPSDGSQVVHGAPAEAMYGMPALDLEALDVTQPSDDLFGQAVGQIVVVGIARSVVEVQHRDAVGIRARFGWARARRRHAIRALSPKWSSGSSEGCRDRERPSARNHSATMQAVTGAR